VIRYLRYFIFGVKKDQRFVTSVSFLFPSPYTFGTIEFCIIHFFGKKKNNNSGRATYITRNIYSTFTPKKDHAVGLNLHDGQSCQLLDGSIARSSDKYQSLRGKGIAITCFSVDSPLRTGQRNVVIIDRAPLYRFALLRGHSEPGIRDVILNYIQARARDVSAYRYG